MERSCDGPRRYVFHGGAAEWTGCPRRALGFREDEWIGVYDRAGGRLTVAEMASAPLLLVDAFDVLDELQAQAAAHKAATSAPAGSSRPGVLR